MRDYATERAKEDAVRAADIMADVAMCAAEGKPRLYLAERHDTWIARSLTQFLPVPFTGGNVEDHQIGYIGNVEIWWRKGLPART